MKESTAESHINSKLFVVLFIILALILAYISFRWRSDRLEETEERATQTQEVEPTEAGAFHPESHPLYRWREDNLA